MSLKCTDLQAERLEVFVYLILFLSYNREIAKPTEQG